MASNPCLVMEGLVIHTTCDNDWLISRDNSVGTTYYHIAAKGCPKRNISRFRYATLLTDMMSKPYYMKCQISLKDAAFLKSVPKEVLL